MPVIKIKVGHSLGDVHEGMRRLMDDFFQASLPVLGAGRRWVPAVDILDSDGMIHVVADLAGVDRQSLSIEIEGPRLRLSGRRSSPLVPSCNRFYQVEMEYGTFERYLQLPCPVEQDSAEARYEDGLLIISVKKRELKKPVKIEIS